MSVNVNTTTNTIVVQNANQTITVVDNENTNIVNVTQPLVNVIKVASPGPQGPVGPTGPQGPSVPFTNIGNGVYATTSSLQVTGSFTVSGSSTFTNIGPAVFSGSVNATSGVTMSSALVSGNVTVLGTASINVLQINTTINSTGSNQLGDAPNDTQTLYGSVIVPTGSLVVSGSTKLGIIYNDTHIITGSVSINQSGSGIPLTLNGRNLTTSTTNKVFENIGSAGTSVFSVRSNGIVYISTGQLYFEGNGLTSRYYDSRIQLGTVAITTASSGANTEIYGGLKVYSWDGGTVNNEVFRIAGNGNVGIGTTTPITTLDVSGSIRIVTTPSAGNVVRPDNVGTAFQFGNGTNTSYGEYRFKSDGGTDLGRFLNTGNFGIGTITPSAKLHISGSTSEALLIASSSAGPALYVSGNGNVGIGTATPISELSVASISGITLQSGAIMPNLHRDNTDGAFLIRSYSTVTSTYTTNVKVRSNGNFLIGTTTDSGYKLDVSGSAQFYKTTSDYIQLLQDANSITFSPNAASYLKYGANTILSMKSGGSNSTLVHGAGTAILAATSTGVSIRSNVDGTAATSMLQVRGSGATSATTALRIENSSATPSLVVLDNGYVGIGTSSAQYQLDLYGAYHQYQAQGEIARYDISNANADQNRGVWNFYTNASATADFFGRFGFKFEGGVTDAYKQFQVHIGDSTTPKFVVDGSGRMGIGTIAPSAQLHVSGSSGSALLRVDSPASSSILYVSGSGNVGIGTSTPTYTLDVNGTSRFQGHIFQGSGHSIISLGNSVNLRSNLAGGSGYVVDAQSYNTLNSTINEQGFAQFTGTYAPTSVSGTPSFNALKLTPTINQTGGANQITRGLYINPTLTSAADYRAIETTSGSVSFNHGATSLMFISSSGNVGIGTSTPTNTLDIVSTTTGSLRISGSAGSQITLVRPTAGLFGYVRYLGSNAMDIGTNGADPLRLNTNNTTRISIADTGFVGIGIGTSVASALLQVRGSGTTSATTAFLVQNSTPTNLLSVLDNGQVSFTSPTMSLAASQSAFSISPIISASNIVGGQYYGVNITPTFFQTTGSQTETAFRVAATFTSSNATATSGSNIIADFGSTSAGSQLTVTDVTSGSIYMVNDVSGIPIIEATSNWDVNIYDFPNKVFEKTGSQVNIYGTMRVSGSFILPLSQSVAPQTGSAYWSGSLLFIYNGTRYMSASFA